MEKVNLLQCNPATLAKTHTTCLPLDVLERLRDVWNDSFPLHKIPNTIRKKERLWAELRSRMQNQYKCASEYCAIEKLGSKETDSKYFRPQKPESWLKKPTEWQNSETLTVVMQQYEDAFPDFEFIGPTPIDFDSKQQGIFGKCVLDELCNLNLSELLRNGKSKIGIIFNLDPHDKPGSHWVCAFINLTEKTAYYYDSYGYQPPKEIKKLLRRCKAQGCTNIIWNDIRHQKKGTECGTYCLYVLSSLLYGKSFREICSNKEKMDDDSIHAIRDLLFSTSTPSMKAIQSASSLF